MHTYVALHDGGMCIRISSCMMVACAYVCRLVQPYAPKGSPAVGGVEFVIHLRSARKRKDGAHRLKFYILKFYILP